VGCQQRAETSIFERACARTFVHVLFLRLLVHVRVRVLMRVCVCVLFRARAHVFVRECVCMCERAWVSLTIRLAYLVPSAAPPATRSSPKSAAERKHWQREEC
jgi:hypothetical protein